MIPKQKKLVALNADIRGMVQESKASKQKENLLLKQMTMRRQSRRGITKK